MINTSYQKQKPVSNVDKLEEPEENLNIKDSLKIKNLEKQKKEINILGAGISGLVSGIILAENGFQVKIFEKRSRIGSFFKKDIHSLRNYSYNYDVVQKYKELGIKISNVYPIFREFRFSPSLEHIEIYSKDKPLFYNFIRGYKDKRSLDVQLFKQAKDYGVQIYFKQNVSLNNSNINIVATGALHRKKIGYGYHCTGISMKKSSTIYIFLNNHSPYEYTYLLPFFDKQATIAIVSSNLKENKNHLKKRFSTLIKNNNIIKKIIKNAKFENEIFGFVSFDVPKTAVKKGKLYIGEAAGFLDATTGFGIHYAILSGYLAAESIIKNRDYDKLWKESFGEELKARHFKRMRLQKLRITGQEKIIEDLIKKYGSKISFDDYKKIKEDEINVKD